MDARTDTSPATVTLDIEGLRMEVTGDWGRVVEDVGLDFAWFRSNGAEEPDVRVIIERGGPGHQDRAEYSLDAARRTLTVRGSDPHPVWETAHLFLRRTALAHLEDHGLPPLHALGVAGPAGGVALALPSGGGKSTLALRAIGEDGVRLLSDDCPLLDGRGRLHPFPVPIGVAPGREPSGSPGRRIEVDGNAPKVAVEVASFADRVQPLPVPLSDLVLGRRAAGAQPRLERIGRDRAAVLVLRHAFLGTGVGGAVRYARHHDVAAVARKVRRVALRLSRIAAALRGARTWRLTMGEDPDRNWEVLRRLLDVPA